METTIRYEDNSAYTPFSDNHMDKRMTIEEIDRDIEKHLASILILKTQRNRTLPISKLPPELLCRIFEFVRDDTGDIYNYSHYSPTLGPLRWVRVTYVCHHWRALAINTPTLWTIPPLWNSRWSYEMLTRSKMAKLTVDYQWGSVSSSLLRSIILDHMSRIKTLKVYLERDSLKILEILPKSAPALESLALTIPQRSALFADEYSNSKLSSHSLGEMPRIQHLELSGINIDWDLHLHGTLTTLKLTTTSIPTDTQFWNALERMPLLETLELQGCFPDATNASPRRSRLYFKNLNSLKVTSTVSETKNLLRGIMFPRSTYISITATQGSAPNFSAIIMLVALHLRINNIALRHLKFILGEDRSEKLHFEASCSSADCWYTVPKSMLSLDFTCNNSSKIVKAVWHLFKIFPLSNVKSVQMERDLDRISAGMIVETFGSLPQLERLQGDLGRNFFRAMQRLLPTTVNPSGQDRPSFPELRTICLSEASFPYDNYYVAQGELTVDALLDCFMWRYEYGAEIYRLELQSCLRVTADVVAVLQEVVVDVSWDGDESGFTDDEDDEEEYYDGYDDDSSDAF